MNWTRQVVRALAIVVLMAFASGCDQREAESVDIAALPYLQETHHRELQAELARLQAERATPKLLDESRADETGSGTTKERAQRQLSALKKICPPDDLRLMMQRIARFYPTGTFQFDPIALERAREVTEQFASRLDAYRNLFRRDGFRFELSLCDGLLADLSFLDHASLTHRLEALHAADVLAGGEPSAAVFPVRNMLRIDTRLAALPSLSARRTAVQLRTDALSVLAALVKHPRCSRSLRSELLSVVEDQLAHWTPDRTAWIGDRALGIHAYELVRDGQLMSILTAKEIAQLKNEGKLNAFAKAVRQSVDDDQWFYLSAMRRVIGACDKPFFERTDVLDQIHRELEQCRETPRYPLFAGTVLLPNLVIGHREQALDRARCEAWIIALRIAVGKSSDWPTANPVTGAPYQVDRKMDLIVVRNISGEQDGEPDVLVPLPQPRGTHRGVERKGNRSRGKN